MLGALAARQPWLLVLLAAWALSTYLVWRRVRLQNPGAPRRLIWHADGAWYWQTNAERSYDGRLLAGTRVLPGLVVLHLRAEGQRRAHAVAIAADSVDADSYRHLRARLRLHRETAE